METDISICSKALVLVGAEGINSFDDGTKESAVCASLYPITKDALLSNKIWGFSMQKRTLQRLSKTPLNEYQFSYAIPKDILRIKAVNNSKEFAIYGEELYSNGETVEIDCQISPKENIMSATFVKALVLEMAKVLSVALMGDAQKYSLFERMAEMDLRKARVNDSQDKPDVSFGQDSYWITVVR